MYLHVSMFVSRVFDVRSDMYRLVLSCIALYRCVFCKYRLSTLTTGNTLGGHRQNADSITSAEYLFMNASPVLVVKGGVRAAEPQCEESHQGAPRAHLREQHVCRRTRRCHTPPCPTRRRQLGVKGIKKRFTRVEHFC